MKSFNRRDKNHFINEEGQNLFEIALRKAMNTKGTELEVTVCDLVGGKPEKGIMICGKDAYVEHIGVEWHQRWCFYYFDKNGRNFIADYRNNEVSIGNGVKGIREEYDAIVNALINCGLKVA